MKETRILMGMPITVEIVDHKASKLIIDKVFSYFKYVDDKFSTFKEESEITLINKRKIKKMDYSRDMKLIFRLSEKTKRQTYGYFDILHKGKFDPSGIVKGWSIFNAANILKKIGVKNYYVEAGGDIEAHGKNHLGKSWRVGIRNPLNPEEIIKVVKLENMGIATSGTYLRGQHIYNPKEGNEAPASLRSWYLLLSLRREQNPAEAENSSHSSMGLLPRFSANEDKITDIVSLTVIGDNIYDADRFATAAFAMGIKGISFIENLKGFEGFVIDKNGLAASTSGFDKFVI